MKEHIKKAWDIVPKSLQDYIRTMAVGAGIGALTAGTAKIFQKLNVPHPAEAVKPQRPYQPHAERPHQQPRWQPQQRNWQGYEQNRRYNPNSKGGHGR